MNSIKNITLVLCLFFLVGCIKFGLFTCNSKKFNLQNIKIDDQTYPVVVLGGGIAGLTSGIFLGQAAIKHAIISGSQLGGIITISHSVGNWAGTKEISGKKLANKIQKHAISSGANIFKGKVKAVDFSTWPYVLKIKENKNQEPKTIKALSCIIAMGAMPNFLNIKGENEYLGKGVSKCSTCDGPLYKNKIVAIVGGGNTAIKNCAYLSRLAKKIYLIVRKGKLRTRGTNVEQILSNKNIEVLYNTTITEIKGDGKKITNLRIHNSKNNTNKDLNVDGLFLAIGSIPKTWIFEKQLELDDMGYIVLTKDQQTSKEGIFAAGDITQPKYKQLLIAAGNGSKAAMQAQNFLEEIGYFQ